MRPEAPADGDVKVSYAYDYMNRRVRKQVYDWDPDGGMEQTGAWEETLSGHPAAGRKSGHLWRTPLGNLACLVAGDSLYTDPH